MEVGNMLEAINYKYPSSGKTSEHGQVLPEGPSEMAPQAVAQFAEEAFLQEDVEHLHRAYGLPEAKTIQVHGVRGKKDNSDTGGEGSLDLQTITALAPNAVTTWWGVDPWKIDGFMLAYAVDVNDHESPPLVHSVSWGDAEALYPTAFVQRLDYELMKLALRGLIGQNLRLQNPNPPGSPESLQLNSLKS